MRAVLLYLSRCCTHYESSLGRLSVWIPQCISNATPLRVSAVSKCLFNRVWSEWDTLSAPWPSNYRIVLSPEMKPLTRTKNELPPSSSYTVKQAPTQLDVYTDKLNDWQVHYLCSFLFFWKWLWFNCFGITSEALYFATEVIKWGEGRIFELN